LLGCYVDEHDHEIGQGNWKYTRLLESIHFQIANMLCLKISPKEIMHRFFLDLICCRDHLATLADVHRVQRQIDVGIVYFDPDDGV
ncbi:hypothetical protein OF83DRAFT_1030320, partial [Amylostereum chailletii]